MSDRALIAEVEAHAYRAWPALRVEPLDGWMVRQADGVTRRANSVWAQACEQNQDDSIRFAAVERFYARYSLPARYQLCPVSQPDGLDAALDKRGYRFTAETAVQIADLAQARRLCPSAATGVTAEVQIAPSSAWRDIYTEVEGSSAHEIDVRMAIMAQVQATSAYVTTTVEGVPAAVGSAVADGAWLGVFNVGVRPSLRRQGAARAVMSALLDWGAEHGAERVYLQVMTRNAAALQLYARYGFATLYHYHYRELPQRSA